MLGLKYTLFGGCVVVEEDEEGYPQKQKLNGEKNGTQNQSNHISWSVMIVLMGKTRFLWFTHTSTAVDAHFLSQVLSTHAQGKVISDRVTSQQGHYSVCFTACYIPRCVY